MITTLPTPLLRVPKVGTTSLYHLHMPNPISSLLQVYFFPSELKCTVFLALFKFIIPRIWKASLSSYSLPVQIFSSHQGLACVTTDHLFGGEAVQRGWCYYVVSTVLNALYSLCYIQALILLSLLLCRQGYRNLGSLRNYLSAYNWRIEET